MSGSDFIETVERFFLDIIGTIIPGMALIIGCGYISNTSAIKVAETLSGSADSAWVFLVGCAYVVGHAVTGFGYLIVVKWVERLRASKIGASLLPFVESEAMIKKKLDEDPIFLAFRSSVSERIPALRDALAKGAALRVLRNLAISFVQNDSQLIYRFTFISLLNLGMATASIIVVIGWFCLWTLHGLDPSIAVRGLNFSIPIALFAALLFLERFYQFNRRTLQVPFSMALVKLELAEEQASARRHTLDKGVGGAGQPLLIYLAGGFKSAWQDVVKAKVPTVRFFDPRSHQLARAEEYTAWDLEAIRRCDCVFANLEVTNPAGYALALEVGFARALGKFVILVDEKSQSNDELHRHLEMVRQSADVVFAVLDEGIQFLDKYRTAV